MNTHVYFILTQKHIHTLLPQILTIVLNYCPSKHTTSFFSENYSVQLSKEITKFVVFPKK